MDINLQHELREMRRQVYQLNRESAQRPIFPYVPTTPLPITIIGGQQLANFGGIITYGIKLFVGTLSAITTQTYDPGTVNAVTGAQTGAPSPAITAWPDGLGYGNVWNGSLFYRVMVVNDGRGTMATALTGGANDDTTYAPTFRQVKMISSRIVAVTLADGTSIQAYSPDLG